MDKSTQIQAYISTNRLVTFIIHPKQINEYSNVNKRYRGLINVPRNPFLCWIFEASNSPFHISWVLCSKVLLKRPWKHLTLSTGSPKISHAAPLFSFSYFFLSFRHLKLNSSLTTKKLSLSQFAAPEKRVPKSLVILSFSPICLLPIFSDLPFQRFLPQPPFLQHSFCSHFPSLSSVFLDGLLDSLPGSSSTCQSPTAASKSEVDSLWPLKMWHVAHWDSGTWLKNVICENK